MTYQIIDNSTDEIIASADTEKEAMHAAGREITGGHKYGDISWIDIIENLVDNEDLRMEVAT